MRRIASILFLLWVGSLFAQVKIGFINSQKILDGYRGRETLLNEYNRRKQEWEAKAQQMQTEIRDMYNALEEQRAMLSEEAFDRRLSEIRQKEAEYQQFLQEVFAPGGKLEQLYSEVMDPFIRRVKEITQRIAQEEGYTVILDLASGMVLYYDEKDDLTQKVLNELNAEFVQAEIDTTPSLLGKPRFWVFKFRELDDESKRLGLGSKMVSFMKAAIAVIGKYEIAEGDRIKSAVGDAGLIGKREEEFDFHDALEVGRLVPLDLVIIGEVSTSGGVVTGKCKVISVKEEAVISEVEETVTGTSEEAIKTLVSKMVEKIQFP
ncbi:hypothetical protein CGW93_00465 [candidate division bacterium WOR-3 4484_18]|uniref:OmpH family outer membrane protein n=1 Tax=candidate division WOR-3 bacterium 4484_18 TaxID=2020626 RepID=A0A257LVU5_UNCW3|nr:MAG: hypothetical protein CGW93_00465 [candidate division bacterium WOR-3 4484_18]